MLDASGKGSSVDLDGDDANGKAMRGAEGKAGLGVSPEKGGEGLYGVRCMCSLSLNNSFVPSISSTQNNTLV